MSLIELMVVVMIVGILTVIATANYLNALQLARQKKTMADMRTIAAAWEARGSETKAFNAAGAAFALPTADISYEDINQRLSPTYLRGVPRLDGWGNPFDFAANQPIGGTAASEYAIRSRGRYGRIDSSYPDARTTNFDCDIIFSAGNFAVYPEGVSQN